MEDSRDHQGEQQTCFCHVGNQKPLGGGCCLANDQISHEGLAMGMEKGNGAEADNALARDGGAVAYDRSEQDVLIEIFTSMLRAVTKDGGRKRAAGTKPPWWRDGSHLGAVFSHLTKWFRGEKVDPDSGVHPLVHGAWRMLAIAYQETYGKVDPQ